MQTDVTEMWDVHVFQQNRNLIEGQNPFLNRYRNSSDDEWLEALIRSVKTPIIDDIAFPRLPPTEVQMRIHGNSDETAIEETFGFYRTVKESLHVYGYCLTPDHRILDFGTGWGRTIRPFLREVYFENLYGYEPNPWFSMLSRALNPYVACITGSSFPPSIFNSQSFDLILSYSVFTHLCESLARDWLAEFARIIRPGGMLFLTTWGERFFDLLEREASRLRAHQHVHWYHKTVIDAMGNIADRRRHFHEGEFVYVDTHKLGTYGEAFISHDALHRICSTDLDLLVITECPYQDLIILRRQ